MYWTDFYRFCCAVLCIAISTAPLGIAANFIESPRWATIFLLVSFLPTLWLVWIKLYWWLINGR